MQPATLEMIRDRRLAKGDVLEVARLAGIMAAKRTGELIPLCHPLGLDAVELSLSPEPPDAIRVEARVKSVGRTGVEMEALVAVTVACLTIYDMCKAVDRAMVIGEIQLEEKTGGRRGTYRRSGPDPSSDPLIVSVRSVRGGEGWGCRWEYCRESPRVKAGSRWPIFTPRSPPSWPTPSGSSRRSWAAGSRSCNTWSTTAPTSRGSGCGRPWSCSRAGPAGPCTASHAVLAAVVEMIHTATLVHDDVLDEAVVRRHAATVNAEWGNETAVLLGDYLFTHAFHLAASLDSTRACRWIGHATNKVCEGEMQQVHHRGNLDLDEAAYFAIIEGKTAELTAVSCRLGAAYAGAPESTVAALDRYGRELGVAFQIADDVLDIWGDERDHRQEPGDRPGEAEDDAAHDLPAPDGRSRRSLPRSAACSARPGPTIAGSSARTSKALVPSTAPGSAPSIT